MSPLIQEGKQRNKPYIVGDPRMVIRWLASVTLSLKNPGYTPEVYIAVNPNHPSDALTTLLQCVENIFSWNTRNLLKSNPGKTEVLHLTSCFMKQPSFGDSITFAGAEIIITKKARNLGVIMDNNLSFSSHINEICKKSTLAIRSIGRIRKYLSLDGLKMLVSALVISRLEYCNCLLYGIPKYQRYKLQRI